ncbi:hypothetical protein E2C01_023945 [Portunus trituberculatus]|uniref:Uncharacterized protein n=1 Tax=Portunus trituberculatus TaxID=210409 RepID=A0A5B7EBB5_PORTR|nr:hypothetical protein [Portunus trituberculatus]
MTLDTRGEEKARTRDLPHPRYRDQHPSLTQPPTPPLPSLTTSPLPFLSLTLHLPSSLSLPSGSLLHPLRLPTAALSPFSLRLTSLLPEYWTKTLNTFCTQRHLTKPRHAPVNNLLSYPDKKRIQTLGNWRGPSHSPSTA